MAINGINGISNDFLNTLTDMSSAQQTVDQLKFEDILKAAQQSASEEESDAQLKEACAEFESYYINKVFSEMRKSIPETQLFEKAQGHEIYEDMLYEEYAKEIAAGKGSGIKDMLYNQLKKSTD